MDNMIKRTISLPEEIYIKLKSKKRKNETFPELIQRLLNEEEMKEKNHKIMDLAGAFGENSDEWEKIEKELYKDRLKPSNREKRIFDNI